jgi:CBS domain-containing protein
MNVGRICVRDVDLADAGETVQLAAARMNDRKVGSLVVVDPNNRPVGIITDRDLAIRVVGTGRDPLQTTVGDVMTRVPMTTREDTPIETALSVMRSGPFRRLPVVDEDGQLVGMLSVDDVLDLLTEEMNQIHELLQEESPCSLGRL